MSYMTSKMYIEIICNHFIWYKETFPENLYFCLQAESLSMNSEQLSKFTSVRPSVCRPSVRPSVWLSVRPSVRHISCNHQEIVKITNEAVISKRIIYFWKNSEEYLIECSTTI